MSGIAGAGKSHVAQMIVKEISAIWISSDGVRATLFPDNTHDHENMTPEKNKMVFDTMDYFSVQAFQSGISVIYDAANNTELVRKKVRDFAKSNGAIPVLVIVDIDVAVAKQRATTRKAGLHAWTIPASRHGYNVKMFEEVVDKENLVRINGQDDGFSQLESLRTQITEIDVE